MEIFLNKASFIVDLQERGFTEDFKVVGDQVLWVQRKLFFKQKSFSFVEAHSFIERDGVELLVLGAILLPHFANGIFILPFEHAFNWRSKLINKKINALLVKVYDPGSYVRKSGFRKLQSLIALDQAESLHACPKLVFENNRPI